MTYGEIAFNAWVAGNCWYGVNIAETWNGMMREERVAWERTAAAVVRASLKSGAPPDPYIDDPCSRAFAPEKP